MVKRPSRVPKRGRRPMHIARATVPRRLTPAAAVLAERAGMRPQQHVVDWLTARPPEPRPPSRRITVQATACRLLSTLFRTASSRPTQTAASPRTSERLHFGQIDACSGRRAGASRTPPSLLQIAHCSARRRRPAVCSVQAIARAEAMRGKRGRAGRDVRFAQAAFETVQARSVKSHPERASDRRQQARRVAWRDLAEASRRRPERVNVTAAAPGAAGRFRPECGATLRARRRRCARRPPRP
jgi:hypothetical protein